MSKNGRHATYARTAFAPNYGRPWTADEVRRCFDASRPDVEIAAELGRSVASVGIARHRYAHLAPAGWRSKGSQSV